MNFLSGLSISDFVEAEGFGDVAFGDGSVPLSCSGVVGLSFIGLGKFTLCNMIWSKAALSVLTSDVRLASADFSKSISV